MFYIQLLGLVRDIFENLEIPLKSIKVTPFHDRI